MQGKVRLITPLSQLKPSLLGQTVHFQVLSNWLASANILAMSEAMMIARKVSPIFTYSSTFWRGPGRAPVPCGVAEFAMRPRRREKGRVLRAFRRFR